MTNVASKKSSNKGKDEKRRKKHFESGSKEV